MCAGGKNSQLSLTPILGPGCKMGEIDRIVKNLRRNFRGAQITLCGNLTEAALIDHMISHGTQVPHRGIEPLALSIGPSRISDTVLIPDDPNSALPASPEEVHRTLRLATADGIEDIETLIITTENISERQEFDRTPMYRTPVVQDTAKPHGHPIAIVPAVDQSMLFEDLPAFWKFHKRSNPLPYFPWNQGTHFRFNTSCDCSGATPATAPALHSMREYVEAP
jgi:hypothetical protein